MNSKDKLSLFCKAPLSYVDDIPVFSRSNGYIENYMKIASDHVKSMVPGQSNPFIEDVLWQTLERSTQELIIKYASGGDRILDVGVGLGRLLGPFDQFDRYGVDISHDYLKVARQAGIEVAFSSIEDMPYCDNTFDVITVCDVLEHVLDLNYCTREILRVLKPKGILIVRVPMKEDLSPYLSPDLPYEFIHLRNFDDASLRLHFCKIFGMQYIESGSVAPYLQGGPRLKIQLMPEAQQEEVLKVISKLNPKWKTLRNSMRVSAEKFLSWIYQLRDEDTAAYNMVANHLVLGMEFNAVFRK